VNQRGLNNKSKVTYKVSYFEIVLVRVCD
jgi:hypothetical protein